MQLTWETGPTDPEIYAYSAAWIIYALALLGLGIVWRARFWRYSSMAVLIVTVLKVFLYDLSNLAGLLRVASFLGLGLTSDRYRVHLPPLRVSGARSRHDLIAGLPWIFHGRDLRRSFHVSKAGADECC